MTNDQIKLSMIETILLDFSELAKEDMTTSDLQGIAMVDAIKIKRIIEA